MKSIYTDPDFNPELITISNAFLSPNGTIESKIKFIYETASILIKETESSYQSTFKKIYRKDFQKILETTNLHNKSTLAFLYKENIPSPIIKKYLDVLKLIKNIRDKYAPYYIYKNQNNLIFNKLNDKEYASHLFNEIVENKSFIFNPILPLFFPLQLECYLLFSILKTPKNTSYNPTSRIEKAQKAAVSRNEGKEILKSLFLKYIKNHHSKYKTIKIFYHSCHSDLTEILNKYTNEYCKNIHSTQKTKLTYGTDIDPENLPRIINDYRKNDIDFDKCFQSLLDRPRKNIILKKIQKNQQQ